MKAHVNYLAQKFAGPPSCRQVLWFFHFFVLSGIMAHLNFPPDGANPVFEDVAPSNLILLLNSFLKSVSVRTIGELPDLFGMLVNCPVSEANKEDNLHFRVCVNLFHPFLESSKASVNSFGVMEFFTSQIVLGVLMLAAAHWASSNVSHLSVLKGSLTVLKKLFLTTSILPVENILRNIDSFVDGQSLKAGFKSRPVNRLKDVIFPLFLLLNVSSKVFAVAEITYLLTHFRSEYLIIMN